MLKQLWANWKRECDKNAAPVYTLAEINASNEELARHRRIFLNNNQLISNPYKTGYNVGASVQLLVDLINHNKNWDVFTKCMRILELNSTIKHCQRELDILEGKPIEPTFTEKLVELTKQSMKRNAAHETS